MVTAGTEDEATTVEFQWVEAGVQLEVWDLMIVITEKEDEIGTETGGTMTGREIVVLA